MVTVAGEFRGLRLGGAALTADILFVKLAGRATEQTRDRGDRGGNVAVRRVLAGARRTTGLADHDTVHMRVKVLSSNPHEPPDWWFFKKKTRSGEKNSRSTASDPK
jgi:hypothetical protein